MTIEPYTFQFRRDTNANFVAANKVYLSGEPTVETDTGKMKLGDGATHWNDLPYVAPTPAELSSAIGAGVTTGIAAANIPSQVASQKTFLQFGPKFAFEGDSITAMTFDTWTRSTNYVASTMLKAKGWIRIVADTGVAGTTTTQMLARLSTDIATMQAAGAQTVVFMGGTNDAGQSIALTTTQSNIRAIIAGFVAAGLSVIICTIPPTDNTTPSDRQKRTAYINEWLRQYAAKQRLLLVDFYNALLDPITGGYTSGNGNGDSGGNVHPSAAGSYFMAKTFLDTVLPYVPSQTARIPRTAVDPLNLYTNSGFGSWSTPITPGTLSVARAAGSTALAAGTYFYKVGLVNLFGESVASNEVSITASAGDTVTLTIPLVTGQKRLRIYRSTAAGAEVLLDDVTTSGSGNFNYADNGSKTPGTATPQTVDGSIAPTGVSNNSSTSPANVMKVTDAEWPTPMMRLKPGYLTNAIMQTAGFGTGGVINPGDIIAVSIPVRGGGSQFTVKINLRDSGNTVLKTIGPSAIPAAALGTDLGIYYLEFAAPASFANLYFIMQCDDAVGWVDFGAPAVVNLTQNATIEA